MAQILALTGFMGSGKSSVGRKVADALGWRFADLDTELESVLGVSIAEYFAMHGERAFRKEESRALRALLDEAAGQDFVLALGGGTLLSMDNIATVRGACIVVLLEVEVDNAWSRVSDSGRPLAQDRDAFGALFTSRRASYEEAADWVLPAAGLTAEQTAERLVNLVESCALGSENTWGRPLVGGERKSLIVGGEGALDVLGRQACSARESGRALRIITDAHVMHAWGERVSALLGGVPAEEVMVLEPGEKSKATGSLDACWEWLSQRNTLRDDIVVALGGGVVGDLAGFVAATFHRGIGLWQVPTSLLAQVDSSVGGKTAINLRAAKNQVGAFYQADLVVIDPATLGTLPQREFVGALGEVVKHALLQGEAALAALETERKEILGRNPSVLSDLVKRNVWLKASVVEKDERELSRRAILNLGHTTAHALESTLGYGSITHGQAVALGLLVALRVSERLLGLEREVRTRTEALLELLGLESKLELPPAEAIIEAAGHDKKVKVGTSGFVGLRGVGAPVWGMQVAPELLIECMEVIRR